MARKQSPPQPYAKSDQIQIRGNQIFSRVRQKWLVQTPEELVRQTFLDVILNEYGFTLAHIAEEEELTGRGTGHARADFVIWRTVEPELCMEMAVAGALHSVRFRSKL